MTALNGARAAAFLNKPDPRIGTVLVYGPDAGLVRERVRQLLAKLARDPDDPFATSRLDEADISADPARLADEAGALVLGGARRVVTVSQAGAATAQALEPLLKNPPQGSVIVVAAGNLRPGAKLRKIAEQAKTAVTIPCYLDEGEALDGLINDELGKAGLTIARGARAHLRAVLGADRQMSRQEIRKLCLYAHGKEHITIEDIDAACGDAALITVERICDATLEGRAGEMNAILVQALSQGIGPVPILGALRRQILVLLEVGVQCAKGRPVDAVMRSLRPPIHFSRKKHIAAQYSLWRDAELIELMQVIARRDAACRQTAACADSIMRQTLLSVCLRAGKRLSAY